MSVWCWVGVTFVAFNMGVVFGAWFANWVVDDRRIK